jgi:hypothetical protein
MAEWAVVRYRVVPEEMSKTEEIFLFKQCRSSASHSKYLELLGIYRI